MPELNVLYTYMIGNRQKLFCVETSHIAEFDKEDMTGVAVDFIGPAGETVQAPIFRKIGFNGNTVLMFEGLNKLYKPIGFSDPNEETLDNPPAT